MPSACRCRQPQGSPSNGGHLTTHHVLLPSACTALSPCLLVPPVPRTAPAPRDASKEAIMFLVGLRAAGVRQHTSVIVKPIKNQTAWRPVLGILALLQVGGAGAAGAVLALRVVALAPALRLGRRAPAGLACVCKHAWLCMSLQAPSAPVEHTRVTWGCAGGTVAASPRPATPPPSRHARSPQSPPHQLPPAPTTATVPIMSTPDRPTRRPTTDHQDLVPLLGISKTGDGFDLPELMDFVGRALNSPNADVRSTALRVIKEVHDLVGPAIRCGWLNDDL